MFTFVRPRAPQRWWRQAPAVVVAVVLAAVALMTTTSPVADPAGAQAAPVPDASQWYRLVNRHSGKALETYEWSTADGADVVQWTDLGGANQQWRFVASGDGWYRLVNRHSGKALHTSPWSTGNGSDIVQYADLGLTSQQWRLADAGDGHVTLGNRRSGRVADLAGGSTADGADVIEWSADGGTDQHWRLVPVTAGGGGGGGRGGGGSSTELVGWATQGGGTTGGGNATPTTVTSAASLSDALAAGNRVIRVSGTISCSGMLRVASNTSVLGNPGATISGCGLNVRDATNVIVRNLSFRGWDDDAVNVEQSQRVWIDHNSFTDGYDGAVDIKRASDYVTVSWNRVHGHDKAMLLGHSDGNGSQDIGRLRVTYHHNWFDGSGTRHPRVRFGNPVHVFNNLYSGNEYGIASTMGAGVLVEGNLFEDVEEPTLVGYADSDPGTLVQRSNQFVRSGQPQSAGSVATIPYDYELEPASSVKASVEAGAGAGRITP